MKYRHFLPYDLAATAAWAVIGATLGYVFGEYWDELLAVARDVGYGFVVLVIFFVVLYAYRRYRVRERSLKDPKDR